MVLDDLRPCDRRHRWLLSLPAAPGIRDDRPDYHLVCVLCIQERGRHRGDRRGA